MASIVSCPGCQKRLKIGTDKPGGKLRCPNCNTPFVLGARSNTGAGGIAEFQAFELFEDDVIIDAIDIEDETPEPPPPPKPLSRSSAAKRPAPSPEPPQSKSKQPVRRDELSAPEAPRPRPAPPPEPEPPPDESALPENFSLHDEAASAWKPRRDVESDISAPKSQAKPASKSPSKIEPKPPPPPPPKTNEFFLPADFDPFAAPAKAPNLSLDEPDDTPGFKDEDVGLIEQDFEVIENQIRTSADGVPLIEGATDEDIAESEASVEDYEELDDGAIMDRVRRRERNRRRARKTRVSSDVRGRWTIVFWGITVELIALGLLLLAWAFGALSVVMALVRGFAASGIMALFCALLLALRELLVMLGYGLCIPAPTKNFAWLWAMLALIFAFTSMGGYLAALIFPPAFLILPLTLVSWFFYLIYLKNIAEALKVRYLEDETLELMKLLGIMVMSTVALWGGMMGLLFIVRPNSLADMAALGYIFATCSCVFSIFSIIMAVVIVYKYYYILLNLRMEIGWRLES